MKPCMKGNASCGPDNALWRCIAESASSVAHPVFTMNGTAERLSFSMPLVAYELVSLTDSYFQTTLSNRERGSAVMLKTTYTLTALSLLLGPGASAQQPQLEPCTISCTPPSRLDTRTCSCAEQTHLPPKRCTLVCLDPDTTIDSATCTCVKR